MEITISGTNRKHLKQVEELAERLGLYIQKGTQIENTDCESKSEKAYEALEELAKMESFKEIDDPVAWQREIRKDRNIGRDE